MQAFTSSTNVRGFWSSVDLIHRWQHNIYAELKRLVWSWKQKGENITFSTINNSFLISLPWRWKSRKVFSCVFFFTGFQLQQRAVKLSSGDKRTLEIQVKSWMKAIVRWWCLLSMCSVYLRLGTRLLCVCWGQKPKGHRAPLDPCWKQKVLCSPNECVNNFVRDKNTEGKGHFGSINSVYK